MDDRIELGGGGTEYESGRCLKRKERPADSVRRSCAVPLRV